MDIVASKKPGLHGQAWIIFEKVHEANKAMVSAQGFEIFGKSMVIEYCKTKSDVVAIADNTWRPKNKRIE